MDRVSQKTKLFKAKGKAASMGKVKWISVIFGTMGCVADEKVKTSPDRCVQASQVMIGQQLTHMNILSKF